VLEEGLIGVSTYCDGEKLVTYLPSLKQYTVDEAPESLSSIGNDEPIPVGMLAAGGAQSLQYAFLGDSVYDTLMEGVTQVKDLGTDSVDGVSCRHLTLSQEEMDWDLWIEQGERPVPHKVSMDLSKQYGEAIDAAQNLEFRMTFRFRDWNTKPEFKDDDFRFTPPDGAQQVDSLFEDGMAEDDEPHPLLGEPAPAFETVDLAGDEVKLADLVGKKVIMLDFWAEWCGPCRAALPTIAKVAQEFAKDEVVLYAVNLGDDADTIREFLSSEKLDIPVALDAEGKIGELYAASAIPQTVLIGKDKRVQVVHVGLLENLEEQLTTELKDLLAGKDLAAATLAAAKQADQSTTQDAHPQHLTLAWSFPGTWQGIAGHATSETLYAIDSGGEVIRLDAQGSEKERCKLEKHGSLLRIANLVGDEPTEVLTFDPWGDAVYAHRTTGELLWTHKLDQGIDDVWAADLTGDGLDEVIVGYNGDTGLHTLDNRGTPLWKDRSLGNVWHVSSGDFNGDGQPDVVTTSAAGQVHVFDREGTKIKDLEVSLYANIVRMVSSAQLEGSQYGALVGGSGDNAEQLTLLSFDGKQQWVLDLSQGEGHIDSLAVARSAPWAAVGMLGGSVQVVDLRTGSVIGLVGQQGRTPQVSWLERNAKSPLLVIATTHGINAFDVDVAN
jgi:thiol-disulfide isomerase/thioredoxin